MDFNQYDIGQLLRMQHEMVQMAKDLGMAGSDVVPRKRFYNLDDAISTCQPLYDALCHKKNQTVCLTISDECVNQARLTVSKTNGDKKVEPDEISPSQRMRELRAELDRISMDAKNDVMARARSVIEDFKDLGMEYELVEKKHKRETKPKRASNGGDGAEPRKRAPAGVPEAFVLRVLTDAASEGVKAAGIKDLAEDESEQLVSDASIRVALNKGRDKGVYQNIDRKWFLSEAVQ